MILLNIKCKCNVGDHFSRRTLAVGSLTRRVIPPYGRYLTSRDQLANEQWKGMMQKDPNQSTADMMVFVQNLLQPMQSRFQTMSECIVTKVDEMGNSMNELEQSINDLRAEMGVDSSPLPVTPSKTKPGEGK